MKGLERFQSKQQPRYVTRPDGQRVEVLTVEFDPPASKAGKAKQKDFTKVELEWLAEMAEVIGCPCATVLVVMRFLAWKARSPTFAFSNTILTRLGVDRRAKYWALESLEAAGKIMVERRGTGKAPIVTLLVRPEGTVL